MRKIVIILGAILIAADCYSQNPEPYTTEDTIVITTEIEGISLKFSKEEFNNIVSNQPELYDNLIDSPDDTYSRGVMRKFRLRDGKGVNFGSAAGQDTYYVLYAYFMKQKYGSEYVEMRKNLISIFLNINSLFQKIQYGGTYFAHQCVRILAYAEYAIYEYLFATSVSELKPYDINKQKDLYIQSLRQLIQNETDIDVHVLGEEKLQRLEELNKIADEIEINITDIFYLRKAQEFQYKYYAFFE